MVRKENLKQEVKSLEMDKLVKRGQVLGWVIHVDIEVTKESGRN